MRRVGCRIEGGGSLGGGLFAIFLLSYLLALMNELRCTRE